MPQNLELKIKLNSFEKIQNILQNIGAEFKGELNQKDIYYKVKSGLLKLRIENGKENLIFYNRDENASDRFSDYELLEISSKNGENFLKKFLEVEAEVEKKRLLYLYDNTRIHLDEVKLLGKYLELETLVLKDINDAKLRFEKIVDLLELEFSEQIKTSYRHLVENKLK
jgi:adenylate cyclase, class 2